MRKRLSTEAKYTLTGARSFGCRGYQFGIDFSIEYNSRNDFTRETMIITCIGYGILERAMMINERERHIPEDDDFECRCTYVVFSHDEKRRAMGEDRNEILNNHFNLTPSHASVGKDWEAIFEDMRQETLDARDAT